MQTNPVDIKGTFVVHGMVFTDCTSQTPWFTAMSLTTYIWERSYLYISAYTDSNKAYAEV